MGRVEHLDWLETFVAVVDSGGFSAAVDAVHRSQSRVSSHVASLEQALGARLFDRSHRPVLLTDAGEAFLPHAREVLAGLARGQAEVDAVLGVVRGHVVLGSYPSASAAFVPTVLSGFSARYPDVSVDLTERPTLDLSEALGSGRVHLALRPLAPRDDTDGLACRPLWREPLVAVCPPDHPLAGLPAPLELSELVKHRLVTIGGSHREVMYEAHAALKQCGTPATIAWQTDQPQTLVNFVRTGLGVGITNRLAMTVSDTAGVVVTEVGTLSQGRTVGVFWDPRRYLPRAAGALLEQIVATAPPFGTVEFGAGE